MSRNNEVCNFFVFTAKQQLVSVEVVDRGFILQDDFPKEGNFIFLDNLQFVRSVHVDHRDLSISAHDVPTMVDSDHKFAYTQTKFSNRSVFKLSTQNSSEETKTLK